MRIKLLEKSDIFFIVDGFANSNWTKKSAKLFERYLKEQDEKQCICLVAFMDNEFAGYIILKWYSEYFYFAECNLPEISDLNVLPVFRNKDIGSSLIEKCEELAKTRSNLIGIGVGLYSDYGTAQRLYFKRGYIPDGNGITYNYQPVIPGNKYPVDDDLVLWLTKSI